MAPWNWKDHLLVSAGFHSWPDIFSISVRFGLSFLIGLYAIYFLVTALDAAIKQKSFYIGLLVVRAIFTQFSGYGWGFLKSYIAIHLQHKDPEKTFPKLF